MDSLETGIVAKLKYRRKKKSRLVKDVGNQGKKRDISSPALSLSLSLRCSRPVDWWLILAKHHVGHHRNSTRRLPAAMGRRPR